MRNCKPSDTNKEESSDVVVPTQGMRELSLFSGAGGGLLASKWLLGWRTVCYVERESYPVEVIKARIRDGLLDDAPIWDDVGTFDGRPWAGLVDVISAGFPCQPFSAAGKRQADADERNGWPDTIRIIREVRPQWAFLENVPGLLSATGDDGLRYFGTILRDLAESGYDARWRVLSAAEVGAPHRRDRLWIVAYRDGIGQLRFRRNGRIEESQGETSGTKASGTVRNVADARESRLAGWQGERRDASEERPAAERSGHEVADATGGFGCNGRGYWSLEDVTGNRPGNQPWSTEPRLDRVADELADRLDESGTVGKGVSI